MASVLLSNDRAEETSSVLYCYAFPFPEQEAQPDTWSHQRGWESPNCRDDPPEHSSGTPNSLEATTKRLVALLVIVLASTQQANKPSAKPNKPSQSYQEGRRASPLRRATKRTVLALSNLLDNRSIPQDLCTKGK